MEFAKAAKREGNFTRTENGALALKTTNSAMLDLYATVGALRGKSFGEIADLFQAALSENKLLATKLMFHARNVRGGLGERETFRNMLVYMAVNDPHTLFKNLSLVPLFGRYDDLYVLIGTPLEDAVWSFFQGTIGADIEAMRNGKSISLCAKWLKSVNTSSKESNALGKKTAKALGMSERQYRKTLSILRDYIKVTERKMSSGEWKEIEYSKVPSHAMKNYRKAFGVHDAAGFAAFMTKVEKGEEKINASTLFPYDILQSAGLTSRTRNGHFVINPDAVLEAQWKALPNYIEGENNVLVMADTSGSMEMYEGLPMATSIGLAVYFAERNRGAYKDLFLTFSRLPCFVRLVGATLREKIACIESIVENTDLEAAFDLILDVAVTNSVSQEEMPKTLIVISDMQFDGATSGKRITHFEAMKEKFAKAGYEMPTLVYWQVAERCKSFQAEADDKNVMLVSGHSTSNFKAILNSIGKNAYDSMLEVLNSEMYACVTI